MISPASTLVVTTLFPGLSAPVVVVWIAVALAAGSALAYAWLRLGLTRRTLAARESTSVMGTAGEAATAMTCAMLRTPGPSRAGPAVSWTVPHAWHPPQRPDHFVVRQPHSAQRYSEPVEDFPMFRTVTRGCDTRGPSGGQG